LPKILVIDDDDAVCAALAAMLAKLGHSSVLASNTIDGIAAAEDGTVDLALIDMNMPGLDGLEAVKAIVRIEPPIPVIGMSGGSTSTSAGDYAILALNFGAALFLPKPFSGDELQRAITTALNASTAR
jgi:DNA-binding NtrC family response regulator